MISSLAAPLPAAFPRACQLCPATIEQTFEGVCGHCERSMCRSCNAQGNECKICTKAAETAHHEHLFAHDRWAGMSDDERGAEISAAVRLA